MTDAILRKSILLGLFACFPASPVQSQDLPPVSGVEPQPLLAQSLRLIDALGALGGRLQPADMWRQALGEDLKIACVLTWGPCWYHQKQFFEGRDHSLSTDEHLMRYDVEVSGFPSSHAGHLVLLRLKEDDYPGTTTVEEWPSWTLPVLRWAKSQGGVTGYSHSGWGLEPQHKTDALPNYVIPKFDGIGANEYVVTVTQDAVDFYSLGDTPWPWELNMWYHSLNVGYRTRASGETDFPCIFDERVGMARTYARLDGDLDFDQYMEELKAGRSYVSDGKSHIIDFKVNSVELGSGESELRLASPQSVLVKARVAARLPREQDALGAFIAARALEHQPCLRSGERQSDPGTTECRVEPQECGPLLGDEEGAHSRGRSGRRQKRL